MHSQGFGSSTHGFEHSGICVEELQLAVGDQMADDEGSLSDSPESFSALKIG